MGLLYRIFCCLSIEKNPSDFGHWGFGFYCSFIILASLADLVFCRFVFLLLWIPAPERCGLCPVDMLRVSILPMIFI